MQPRLFLVLALLVPSLLQAAETAVSTPRFGPARSGELRLLPFVASGGDTDLVVWEERLMGAWPHTSQLKLRTIGPDGEPRQRVQIDAGTGIGPRAVWNGADFFVAYGRQNSRFGSTAPIPIIEAVRVTSEGQVLEQTRVVLQRSTFPSGGVAGLAWDGAHYLVATTEGGGRTLLVDRDGGVVREIAVKASSVVALPGGGFAALRAGNARIDIIRLDAAGNEVGTISVGALANFGFGRFAVHGDHFGVVWKSPEGIVGVELDADGHVLTSTPFPPDAIPYSLGWREGTWVAAYRRGTTSCAKRFAPGREPSETCREATQPFVGETRSAWVTTEAPDPQVLTSRDADFTAGELASETAAPQSEPAAAGSLVAWIEDGTLHAGVHRVPTIEQPSTLRVAAARDQILVLSIEGLGNLRATRVAASGAPLAPPFDVSKASAAPSVASDGSEWLVAWNVAGQIQTARVTANGDVLPAVPLFANAAYQWTSAVAWTGRGYLVAWAETENSRWGRHERVITQLVDASGNRIANAITPIDRRDGGMFSWPAIACGAASCLVTWIDGALYGAIVTPDGATEPRLLSRAAASRTVIAAESDGTFRVIFGNRALRVASSGAPFEEIVWAPAAVTAGGIVGDRVVYLRTTGAAEELGGVTRVFTRELLPLLRMRAVGR